MSEIISTDNKERERAFIIECIGLYRDLPALWNVKSKIYHDRDQKNMAYDLLLSKYKEMFPYATKEEVKKKFNSLRTNYRKELKKHINSFKSGAGSESIYEPSLWYYGEMTFLQDQELPVDSESSMDSTRNCSDNEKDSTKRCASTLDEDEDFTLLKMANCPKKKKLAIKANKEEQLIDLAYERLNETKDEYDYWAMACASDLRKIERTQQLYVKKAFAEIILEAQLGLLHHHSIKINEPLPYCPSTNSSSTYVNPTPYSPSPNSNLIYMNSAPYCPSPNRNSTCMNSSPYCPLPNSNPTYVNPASLMIRPRPIIIKAKAIHQKPPTTM